MAPLRASSRGFCGTEPETIDPPRKYVRQTARVRPPPRVRPPLDAHSCPLL
jgi:hypothetical protein